MQLQGAIVVCYGEGRRVTANFGGMDVVPLQGAIAVCYGWGGWVTTNFGGVDVVPLITQNCFLLSGVYAGIIFRIFVKLDDLHVGKYFPFCTESFAMPAKIEPVRLPEFGSQYPFWNSELQSALFRKLLYL